MKKGKVFLIGAGPGDPKLITLKGLEALKEADCIIYDYLVNASLLHYRKKDAEIIYVGKKQGDHTLSQDKINKLLIRKAMSGRTVARLKGGDPFIFGRGGEEALSLAKAKVPFEVISGITSAISVPAYAGIPLTDRTLSSTCTFITGQEDPKKKESGIDWKNLAKTKGTLVFLMGTKNLRRISNNLIKNGMNKETPLAVITKGTLPTQKTLISKLKNANKLVIKPPSIIAIGDVVSLRKHLIWYEKKPLFGKNILVTRMEDSEGRLSNLLKEKGATPIEFPTIETHPLKNYSSFDSKISEFSNYDWVIFTSANGIRYTLHRLNVLKKDIRELKGPKICAIGPKTKERIEELGLKVEYIPYEYCAEAIVKYFKNKDIKNKNILILRAKIARNILPFGLKKLGAKVDCIPVYETKLPKLNSRKIDFNSIDCLTFTSSSTVKNFIKIVSKKNLKCKKIAVIGPVTSRTCKDLGIKVNIQAKKYTLDGLVNTIADYYKRKK